MQNKVGFASIVHFIRQTFEDCRQGCEFLKVTITLPEKADYVSVLTGMLSICC
jgi:hypothetical protein